jgi:plasmid stabilization system protein ParE
VPFGNYVIFYAPASVGIHVPRILHGARDIDALFRGDTSDRQGNR